MACAKFAAILLPFAALAASWPADAQQSGTSACDVPVVAVQVDAQTRALDLVTDLTATDFKATQAGHGVPVISAAVDTGPKRIVFLFDASKRVDKKQWNLQIQLAEALVANGRSGDTFSIFVTPDAGSATPFASVEENRATLRRLTAARPNAEAKRNPIYESLWLAAKIFGTPQFGDSIVMIGFREDAQSKNKPDYVMGHLIQNGIRLHAIDITDSGDIPSRSELAIPGAITIADRDEANLFSMSVTSGGASRTVRRDRPFKDDFVFQHRLQVLYEGITRPYRLTLQLDTAAKARKLEISAVLEKKPGPTVILSYPRVFIGCPGPAAKP